MVGLLIISKALYIQTVEGEVLRQNNLNSVKTDTISGERGNIYTEDGKLLATSVPSFNVNFDTQAVAEEVFNSEVDSLAEAMASYFQDASFENYKAYFLKARNEGKRFLTVRKDINFNDLKIIKSFPIFRYGQYKGGLIVEQTNRRTNPYDLLARRTIGYERDNAESVGLEVTFDQYLRGTSVPRTLSRSASGDWVPLFDAYDMDVKNGDDLYTTLDIEMQDVVENALLKSLYEHKAKHGCAIVMETATGKIKAIANLGTIESGGYYEVYNYAIAESAEPGSTFKIASLTALLDDGFITDTTEVDIENGKKLYHDKWMNDASHYSQNQITVRKMMEISSNVGISKLVIQHYGAQPGNFVRKLEEMHLAQKTGIEISGESDPVVKKPTDKDWSGTTLPWMSIGYELRLTPLQLLAFVNAVANDGKMMKPYIINSIRRSKEIIQSYEPQMLKQVCQPTTARMVQNILQGVVENGTAKSISSDKISMAGKTGTSKIARDDKGYRHTYQASFVGFFPAENPMYSCIVVLNSPQGDYYGGAVAAPVFAEIVSRFYSKNIEKHEPINKNKPVLTAEGLPVSNRGYQKDIASVYNQLGVSNAPSVGNEFVVPQRKDKSFEMMPLKIAENVMPSVVGMGLRDAIYILENQGLKVKFSGRGKVTRQAPTYGTRIKNGEVAVIELH